jgi:ERCC4-type nuclease
MVMLSVVLGIPILRTGDPAETARLLIYAGQQLARRVAGAVARPGYRPKGLLKRQMFLLQGLPGVGRKRAAALLEHFHTPAAVLAAPEEDLARVDGIGVTTARALRRIAHEVAPE